MSRIEFQLVKRKAYDIEWPKNLHSVDFAQDMSKQNNREKNRSADQPSFLSKFIWESFPRAGKPLYSVENESGQNQDASYSVKAGDARHSSVVKKVQTHTSFEGKSNEKNFLEGTNSSELSVTKYVQNDSPLNRLKEIFESSQRFNQR